jgi:hypothetical protein
MEVYMFLKNNFRPAFATAGADNTGARKQKNDMFTFETGASENDEFGAFAGSAKKAGAPGKQGKGPKGSKPNVTSIIIAAAAVVAVILIIALVAIFASGNTKDVKIEDNAYITFSDPDGIFYVASNGVIVAQYEDEIKLVPAADNSFAYVIESGDEGYRVHIVKDKKITTITSNPVDKVLATASLEPGVVWLEVENGVYFYNEKDGEQRISRNHADELVVNPYSSDEHDYMFYISADASTVTYAKWKDDLSALNLYIFKNGNAVSAAKNLYPVSVSDNGDFIYAMKIVDGDVPVLIVLSSDEPSKREQIAENFAGIIDTNVAGNEVLYAATTSDGTYATYLYSFNAKKIGDNESQPAMIGKDGIYRPISFNNDVARFSTFADKFYSCPGSEETSTYYINKKYERSTLAKQNGKFDPNGNYFYYTTKDNVLMWIDLDDEQFIPNKISSDVVDYEVTSKGNAYWISEDGGELSFFDRAKDKSTRIQLDVEEMSMHAYTNTLYFKIEGDEVDVYCTKEGSSGTIAKFGNDKISSVPEFINGNLQKTYAAMWDDDNSDWRLFYTANGKTFKFMTTTVYVQGLYHTPVEAPAPEEEGEGEGEGTGEGEQ